LARSRTTGMIGVLRGRPRSWNVSQNVRDNELARVAPNAGSRCHSKLHRREREPRESPRGSQTPPCVDAGTQAPSGSHARTIASTPASLSGASSVVARDAWVMATTPRPIIDSVVRSVCGREVERIVRLTAGGLNETYRVELPNDVAVVVRIARQPVPWFTDEEHVMAQARGVGVPTPEVLGEI